MAEPLTPTSIEALIEGGVTGRIAAGNYDVRIHPEHGAVVTLLPPERRPAPPLRGSESEERPADDAPIAPDRRALAILPDEEKRLLSALAAVGGGPVGAAHLPFLADVPEPGPALGALLERRLAQAQGPRYGLTGDLAALLRRTWDLSSWSERALGYFTLWASPHTPASAVKEVTEEISPLRHLLGWAVEAGRFEAAIHLGRALDTACAVGGRWDAWGESLERVRAAAAASGNRAAEGWALHQLGTRLLCLDDPAGAKPLLTQALAIRESLGDRAGAAVTRHNLGFLGTPPARPPASFQEPIQHPSWFRLLPGLALVFLIFVVLAVGGIKLLSNRLEPDRDTVPTEPVTNGEESPSLSTDAPAVSDLPVESTDLSTDTAEPVEEAAPERPVMTLSPQEVLDFGEVNAGERLKKDVTVQNAGNAPLTISAISISGERAEELTIGEDCDGEVLDAGESCTFPVTFEPAARGSRNLRLTVSDRASGIEQTLEVRGNAVWLRPEPPVP
ncbi:MAG TPA: choice-of-anchor D domain-containing protein [Thermoanaerobaculia bacterium]|nr:choice-of-anchor D domain-containing protein [Thermoanaerobaculia bacterium]